MRRVIALGAVTLALALCATAAADVPETISYQGVLRDAEGNPVPDGTYSITFRLYDVEAGGTALWTETHSLPVAGGIMNAHLGSIVSLTTLEFLVPYWLSVQVGVEPELAPRVAFETVPYAAHAAFADRLTNGGWEVDGDNVYHEVGNVGIGTPSPQSPLHIRRDWNGLTTLAIENQDGGASSAEVISFADESGSAIAWIGTYDDQHIAYPSALVIANNRTGGHLRFHSGGNEKMRLDTNGNLGIGTMTPGEKLDVSGTAKVVGFHMPTGAAAGYVLTSDASGVGTWQQGAGGDADWVISGSNMYSGVSGYVGIGDSTPDAKLHVYGSDGNEALLVRDSGAPARVVNIERTTVPASFNDILQITVPGGSPDDFQYVEFDRGGTINFAVNGNGRVEADGGALFAGSVDISGAQLTGSTTTARAAEFTSSFLGTTHVVHAECTGVGAGTDPIAVYGTSTPADGYGIGGYFQAGYRAVIGSVQPTGSSSYRGVFGQVSGGTGWNYGLYGSATGGNTSYGVYAQASGGATNYAGYFSGNTHVAGTLSKTAGSFKIDHPLDPTGKYLQHSFVESPDMMNIYNGNVELDERGEALVELPEWFEALNQDFRYQLTCIGGFAPVYVAEEVAGNRFRISGGEAGMKVSWQVTGVRHDAYAAQNRIEVEVAKPAQELGKYMHPEVYGMPETAGVNYHDDERPLPESGRAATPVSAPVRDPNDGE